MEQIRVDRSCKPNTGTLTSFYPSFMRDIFREGNVMVESNKIIQDQTLAERAQVLENGSYSIAGQSCSYEEYTEALRQLKKGTNVIYPNIRREKFIQ